MSERGGSRQPFDPRRQISPEYARRYARFEVLHTTFDFAAATLFVIGSILFFFDGTMATGTWAFLIGSVCFLLKPTIRLVRELWLLRQDDIPRLASAAPEGPGEVGSRRQDESSDA